MVNPVGRIVPPDSLLKGLQAAPSLRYEMLEYAGDVGPMIQHLGPLIAPAAHRHIWPRILDWIEETGPNTPVASRQ